MTGPRGATEDGAPTSAPQGAVPARERSWPRAIAAAAAVESAEAEAATREIDHLLADVEPHTAVALVGLAGFRGVNDLYGRVVGDRALAEVAQRLQGVVDELAPDARVMRHHGAEYLVALPGSDIDEAERIAEAAVERLRVPTHVSGRRLYLRAAAGVAAAPGDADGADALVHAATLALDEAFAERRAVARAASHQRERRRTRLAIEERLPGALDENALHVALQPLVDLETRRVLSVETLARWDDPQLGSVAPGRFVPAASATGTIALLGRVVLEQALSRAARWHREGWAVPIAVNVSAEELRSASFVDGVLARLEHHGVPPDRLELEISEETSVEHDSLALASLAALAGAGVLLALDDFGARFSSLATLRTVPLDHIKLDRDLVHRICDSETDRAIVQAIVAIGHDVGARVTAEGIEDEPTVEVLLELGVRCGQGYALGRPAAPEVVEERLRTAV